MKIGIPGVVGVIEELALADGEVIIRMAGS